MVDFATQRPSALAQARQQLYGEGKPAEIGPLVDACLPKDGAGNLIASQEQSKLPSAQMPSEYILIKPLYVLPGLGHLWKSLELPSLCHVFGQSELILAA